MKRLRGGGGGGGATAATMAGQHATHWAGRVLRQSPRAAAPVGIEVPGSACRGHMASCQ
eukprot:SAG22_NODE_1423_length_4464_cov_2.703551_2_plen_59_part_00